MNAQLAAELDTVLSSYRPRVAAFIAKMTQSEGDVEDLVQETLLRMARGWEGFRGDSSLSSWIFQIASNVCVDYFRARSSRPEPAREEKVVEAPSSEGVLRQMEKKEMGECVHDHMSNLPEAYKRILIMRYMDGATLKEIAEADGISENSAKVRLHRARKRFRESCLSSCEVSSDGRGEVACGPKDKKRGGDPSL